VTPDIVPKEPSVIERIARADAKYIHAKEKEP
jgi:hypothetical protein